MTHNRLLDFVILTSLALVLGACSPTEESVDDASGSDTVAPSVAITDPTSGSSWNTSSSTLQLSGTASDNVGVSSITWTNDRGGSGSASGTSNWTSGMITLQNGTTNFEVSARDAAGNVGRTNLAVTFSTNPPSDTTPPTVASTQPATNATNVAVGSTVQATFSEALNSTTVTTSTFTLRITGGSSVSGTVSYSGGTATFTPAAALTGGTSYTARLTTGVRDVAGNAMAAAFSWTFTTAGTSPTNRAPTISGTPSASVVAGSPYSFTPSASDPDGDTLTFSITNRPTWAAFNTTTGALTGTPTAAQVGNYSNIRISVSDGRGGTASLAAFTIAVVQVATGSVTLSWDPPTTNADGSPLTDLASYRIYYGTTSGNYPNVRTVSNPGMATFVVDNLVPGAYVFVITALDTSSNESARSNEATATVQ
jgi:hypothetical protein